MDLKKIDMRAIINVIRANRLIVLLLILNFLANFLFLLWFKFYSDDWSMLLSPDSFSLSLMYQLADSQRPLLGAIFYFEMLICGQNALAYHIVTLLVNSALVILFFLIFRKIFSEFGCKGDTYAFIATAIYIVLYNKDQVYAWAIMSGLPYLIFALCIYYYMYRTKWYHVYLSMAMYLLGLFTYEVGIALPAIFFVYEVLRKKDLKTLLTPLLFAIPLGVNLLVRFTDWFGFGHNSIPRSFAALPLSALNQLAYSATEHFFRENYADAIIGLKQMDTIWLAGMLLIDIIFIYIAYRQIKFNLLKPKGILKLAILGIVIVAGFILPHYLQAYIDSRHFIFVDLGFALLLTLAICLLPKWEISKAAVFIMLGLGLILCQGLFMNWVICGNLLDDINQHITANADEIDRYTYIYFNSTSFTISKPNTIQLYDMSSAQRAGISPVDNYYYYFNAKCMDAWSLESMLKRNFNISNKTIIYAGLSPVINRTGSTMTILDAGTGQNATIDETDYYEISYEAVYGVG